MRNCHTLKLSQFHKAKTCWIENWWFSGIKSNFLREFFFYNFLFLKLNRNFKHELSPSKPLLRSNLSLTQARTYFTYFHRFFLTRRNFKKKRGKIPFSIITHRVFQVNNGFSNVISHTFLTFAVVYGEIFY